MEPESLTSTFTFRRSNVRTQGGRESDHQRPPAGISHGPGCPCCGRPDCASGFLLSQLEDRVAALQEENHQLRASASAFADLADRFRERLSQSQRSP
jgi:hypothetical protein